MTIGHKIPSKPKYYTQKEIAQRKEYEKFKECYIFVNTNFKRKSEPIFALAFLEYKRHISLLKDDLIFKTDEEVFKIIGAIVKHHFITSNGQINMWGKIVNYKYYHKDGNSYVFDIDGNIIIDEKVIESRASLCLK